jgi:hypothetical protein
MSQNKLNPIGANYIRKKCRRREIQNGIVKEEEENGGER